jgi:hypothetical protein
MCLRFFTKTFTLKCIIILNERFHEGKKILAELKSLRLVVFGAARTETPLPNVRRVKQAIFNMEKSVVLLDDPHIYDDLEELLILFQCYRRWKGRLTHLRLSQMEKRFIATGQGARFDAFFDVIKQLLAPECITPHG